MPRNLHSFCPESCTLAPNPARWDTRVLGKPFHTWHPGMTWWKEKPLARWNDAERQSAKRGRRLTGRLSHVRESKQRHGFRSSKTSRLFPLVLYHLLSSSTLPLWTIFFGVLSPILRRKRRASLAPAVKALRSRLRSLSC